MGLLGGNKNERIYRVPPVRLALIILVSLTIIGLTYLLSGEMTWKTAVVYFLYTFFFWQGNVAFACIIDPLFPSLDDMPKRLAITLLFVAIYTALIVALINWVMYNFKKPSMELLDEYLVGFGITLLISAIYSAAGFFHMYKNSLLEAESLKRSGIESELKALSSQVNPHFLFNSLNTLMSIIPEDQQLALEFTRRFSEVYRYFLRHQNQELATVKEEMEFVENYFFLLKTRHGDNINLEVNLEKGDYQKKIPAFALQLLIENAAKHNEISLAHPLRIAICKESEMLTVTNNLKPRKSAGPGTGSGLDNIRKRFEYLAGKVISVEKTAEQFIVKMPLLEVENYEASTKK